MDFIKKILFVSYLKNKGARRICFILGCLFLIVPTQEIHYKYKQNNYKQVYNDIEHFSSNAMFYDNLLKNAFNNYKSDTIPNMSFDFWKALYIGDFVTQPAYKQIKCDYNSKYVITDDNGEKFLVSWGDKNATKKDFLLYIEIYKKHYSNKKEYLSNFKGQECIDLNKAVIDKLCNEINRYTSNKIIIESFDISFLFEIWKILFAFYLPFFVCCVFRWIKEGFKESKQTPKSQD